eukprot:TRINITY_DN552_c0_g1_i2.p1 TRINITY_DN552_c0_g1~~TRINITY_DN552_c0_g1_i2.p1  ORF type:complete len:663 (+),score=148.29 TRINITY_DN552_c0_g1_i2:376-2364(+)
MLEESQKKQEEALHRKGNTFLAITASEKERYRRLGEIKEGVSYMTEFAEQVQDKEQKRRIGENEDVDKVSKEERVKNQNKASKAANQEQKRRMTEEARIKQEEVKNRKGSAFIAITAAENERRRRMTETKEGEVVDSSQYAKIVKDQEQKSRMLEKEDVEKVNKKERLKNKAKASNAADQEQFRRQSIEKKIKQEEIASRKENIKMVIHAAEAERDRRIEEENMDDEGDEGDDVQSELLQYRSKKTPLVAVRTGIATEAAAASPNFLKRRIDSKAANTEPKIIMPELTPQDLEDSEDDGEEHPVSRIRGVSNLVTEEMTQEEGNDEEQMYKRGSVNENEATLADTSNDSRKEQQDYAVKVTDAEKGRRVKEAEQQVQSEKNERMVNQKRASTILDQETIRHINELTDKNKEEIQQKRDNVVLSISLAEQERNRRTGKEAQFIHEDKNTRFIQQQHANLEVDHEQKRRMAELALHEKSDQEERARNQMQASLSLDQEKKRRMSEENKIRQEEISHRRASINMVIASAEKERQRRIKEDELKVKEPAPTAGTERRPELTAQDLEYSDDDDAENFKVSRTRGISTLETEEMSMEEVNNQEKIYKLGSVPEQKDTIIEQQGKDTELRKKNVQLVTKSVDEEKKGELKKKKNTRIKSQNNVRRTCSL